MVHPLAPRADERIMKHADSKMLVILDTMHSVYRGLVEELGVTLVLVRPVATFAGIKPFAYRLINRKKLAGIVYGREGQGACRLPRHGQPAAKTAKTDPKAAAVYLHSGGTSGLPKTIELSAYAINTLAFQTPFVMEEPDFNGRHMLGVLPMFHGFGLCMGIHAMLSLGGTDTLMPKFKADQTIDLIKKNRINYVIGVPTLFESLLNHPKFAGKHLANLRRAYVGGDFVSAKLKEDFSRVAKEWGSTAELLEGYGLTEMVTVLAVNTPSNKRPDTVGHPLPGIGVKILDVANQSEVPMGVCGEIAVTGETMMIGYLHDPAATAQSIISLKAGKYLPHRRLRLSRRRRPHPLQAAPETDREGLRHAGDAFRNRDARDRDARHPRSGRNRRARSGAREHDQALHHDQARPQAGSGRGRDPQADPRPPVGVLGPQTDRQAREDAAHGGREDRHQRACENRLKKTPKPHRKPTIANLVFGCMRLQEIRFF
ncbi:MAG: AMP-binding protein [Bacillus subtilis]|nr:AMP-binding protein [Bacillus subtilis]